LKALAPLPSRRKFLTALGLSLAGAPLALKAEGTRRTRWEMLTHDEEPVAPIHRPDPRQWSDDEITVAWIGHATVLINFFGTWIITDPVLLERIGLNVAGLFTVGPRRLVLPALTFEELPQIDLILLSHAHMDHLDIPTLRKFHRSTPIVIAKNTLDVVEDLGFQQLYELDWGEWTKAADVRIEALEVTHFGWRYPWEKDRSKGFHEGRSYNAYLLTKNGRSVLFGGDTAYHERFRVLKERDIPLELAIMPIGAYDPWIRAHASPEQALAMADQMGAYHVLPIHWSTFIQSEEPTSEPIERMKKAAAAQQDRIVIDAIGKTWVSPASLAAASPAELPRGNRTEHTSGE
jgi:L-ascorbate metabolism protein UlaG (beta-lactamase superfamily)